MSTLAVHVINPEIANKHRLCTNDATERFQSASISYDQDTVGVLRNCHNLLLSMQGLDLDSDETFDMCEAPLAWSFLPAADDNPDLLTCGVPLQPKQLLHRGTLEVSKRLLFGPAGTASNGGERDTLVLHRVHKLRVRPFPDMPLDPDFSPLLVDVSAHTIHYSLLPADGAPYRYMDSKGLRSLPTGVLRPALVTDSMAGGSTSSTTARPSSMTFREEDVQAAARRWWRAAGIERAGRDESFRPARSASTARPHLVTAACSFSSELTATTMALAAALEAAVPNQQRPMQVRRLSLLSLTDAQN